MADQQPKKKFNKHHGPKNPNQNRTTQETGQCSSNQNEPSQKKKSQPPQMKSNKSPKGPLELNKNTVPPLQNVPYEDWKTVSFPTYGNPQQVNRNQKPNPALLPKPHFSHEQKHGWPGYHLQTGPNLTPRENNFEKQRNSTSQFSLQQSHSQNFKQEYDGNQNQKRQVSGHRTLHAEAQQVVHNSRSGSFQTQGGNARPQHGYQNCSSRPFQHEIQATRPQNDQTQAGSFQSQAGNARPQHGYQNSSSRPFQREIQATRPQNENVKTLSDTPRRNSAINKSQWNVLPDSRKFVDKAKGRKIYPKRSRSRNKVAQIENVIGEVPPPPPNLINFARSRQLQSRENSRMEEVALISGAKGETGSKDGNLLNDGDSVSSEGSEFSVQSSRKSVVLSDDECSSSVKSFSSNVHITAKGIIGVFWDIENCPVPKGHSPREIVKKIRDTFYGQRKEDVFTVACDVTNLPLKTRTELNNAQIDLVHVDSTKKNAADFKLSDYLRRFVDVVRPEGSCVVLISGDVDFLRELHNLRYRHQIYVVLIPNRQARPELCDMANEVIPFDEFTKSLTALPSKVEDVSPEYLMIQNIPQKLSAKVFVILKNIVRNLKGELMTKILNGSCIISFSGKDEAERAFTYFSGKKEVLFESEEVIIIHSRVKPKLPEKMLTAKVNINPEVEPVKVNEVNAKPEVLPLKSDDVSEALDDTSESSPKTSAVLLLESDHVAGPEFWKSFLRNILRDDSAHDIVVESNQIHVCFSSINAAKKVKKHLEKDEQSELKVIGIHKGTDPKVFLGNVKEKVSVMKLVTQCKMQFLKKSDKCIVEHSQKRNEIETEVDGLNQVLSTLPSHTKPLELAMLNAQIHVIKAKLVEFENQEAVFKLIVSQTISDLDLCNELFSLIECEQELALLKQNFSMECNIFSKALPIYIMKTEVVKLVQENPVSILLAAPGSGKSTQITQFLYLAGLAKNGIIVCTQSRKLAAHSLSVFVSSQLGCTLGTLVGSKVGLQSKYSNDTKILYMADHCLLNECFLDPTLSKYSCVIVDEVHERSIFTDLLMGMLKKILQQRPEFRILLSSSTKDPVCFKTYFSVTAGAILEVPQGNLFPVEIIFNKNTVGVGYNYLDKAVLTAFDVHNSEEPGHILVFLTTPAETLEACEAFENLIKKQKLSKIVVCMPLHDKLDEQEKNQVYSSAAKGTRKVIFATNCAESSIIPPGISYVIDTGMAKEPQFDAKTQSIALHVKFVSKYSADQRAGSLGRTQGAKCFRLFSKENYDQMIENTVPEVSRVDLSQTLLKIMQLGIDNPCNFEFVDSPPPSTFLVAMKNLCNLDAVSDDRITELGHKIAKLSLEPSLAKLIIRGFEESVGYEAVIIAAIGSVVGSISFKLMDTKNFASFEKPQDFQDEGDFHTFLKAYKDWLIKPKAQKSEWCLSNNINGKAMKITNDRVREILQTCEQELGIPFSSANSSKPLASEILQYLILEAFKQNLCVFSAHSHVGYISVKNLEQVSIHPSSSLYSTPKYVIYQTKIVSSKVHIMNVIPVSESCLKKAIDNGLYDPKVMDKMKEFLYNPVHFGPFGNRVLKQFCGAKGANRMLVEKEISKQVDDKNLKIELEFQKGTIVVICKEKHHRLVNTFMESKIDDLISDIKKEDQIISLDGTSEGITYVLSAGAAITEAVMPGEFLTFSFPSSENNSSSLEVCQETKHSFTYKEVIVKKNKEIFVTFKNTEAAMETAHLLKGLNFPVRPEIPLKSSQNRKDLPFFKMEVSWVRRPCKGIAFLKFANQEDSALYSPKLINSKKLLVSSKRFSVTVNKNKNDELYISKLDALATQETVRDALKGVIQSDVKYELRIVLEDEFETSGDDMKMLELQLASVFGEYTHKSGVLVNVMKPRKNFSIGRARVFFQNARDGQVTFNALKNHVKFPGTQFPIEMEMDMNSTIVCHKDVFYMVKDSLEETMEGFKKAAQDEDVLSIDAKQSAIAENFVVIRIHSNNIRDMELTLNTFQDILKGDQMHCLGDQLKEKLFLEAGKIELKFLEEKYRAKIHMDSIKKIISILGSVNAIALTKVGIRDYLDVIDKQLCEVICFEYPKKSKGLLKFLFRKYDHTLERFHIDCGLTYIHLNISKHSITVFGSKDAIQKAKDNINEMDREFSGDSSSDDEEACALCLCAIADDDVKTYRLQCCGHIYCMECIQAQLKDGTIPLACVAKDCEELFVMEDLNSLLDQDSRSKIATAALQHAVKVNGKQFQFCPTLECPVVYKVPPEGKVNTRLFCNICTNYICTRCNVIYHQGVSCHTYQNTKTDEDFTVMTWLKESPTKRTLCPKCNIGIERNGESNHMSCWKCSAHMCWLCMTVFPTASEVCDHQTSCQGNQDLITF